MPNISYGKKNHYGRRRDGSRSVFDEIKSHSVIYDFLINHIERIKYNGKWVIILQYIDGYTLSDFIRQNKSDLSVIKKSVIALAKTLAIWHNNGFAHGDPHLENCMIKKMPSGDLTVYLIDYCQLHHEDYKYCQKYNCFLWDKERRIKEDLTNNTGYFGNGFRSGLLTLENELNYEGIFTGLFDEHYKKFKTTPPP